MLLSLSCLCGLLPLVLTYNFKPSNEAVFNDYAVDVPTFYNISDTQLVGGITNTSYWISSFITGTNGHEYLTLSHAFVNVSTIPGFYRASIFDITEKVHYSWNVAEFYSGIPTTTLNITFDNFQFQALSADSVSTLHTSSTYGNLGYDMTVVGSHPVFYNYGSGAFFAGTGFIYEWAIPSMKTTGTLTVNGTKVQIDPDNSFSWYDRQWGPGVLSTGNWTWFELHFDNGVKASIWNWENAAPYDRKYAATFQMVDGTHFVTPVTFTANYTRSYKSTVFDFLYAQDWKIQWGCGEYIKVSSVFPDQELKGQVAQTTAYEGFVTVDGKAFGGLLKGYGVVEIVDLKG